MDDSLAFQLHAGRGLLLDRLPKAAPVFCSVGCAGTWYFDWIEERCGPIGRHIGLELYQPKPPDLPPNVEWLVSSASDMRGVADGEVDVLFSGQNLEHLFAEQVKGFFREANRVLRAGGTLCVDSPNRHLTIPHSFHYHEHVLEFSVNEAITLVRLAGFEVEAVDGVWECDDRRQGLLPLWPSAETPDNVARREAGGIERPHQSLLWWVVGRKVGPVSPQLDAEVDRLFARELPAFVRGRVIRGGIGRLRSATGTEVVVELGPSDFGHVFFGPYIPLAPGDYRAEFLVKALGPGGELAFDITSNGGHTVHCSASFHFEGAAQGWQSVGMRFLLDRYTTAIEARCHSAGSSALVRLGAQIMPWD